MNTKQLEDKLRTLGLAEREIPVYMALLKVKQAKVADIAAWTGIYRPNVYTLLKGLIERGFVIATKGRVQYFRAADPGTAFQSIMDQRRKELARSEVILTELTQLYRERDDSKKAPEGIEVLTLNHGELVLDWLNETKQEVLSLQNTPTPKGKPMLKRVRKIDRIEHEKLAAGVAFRCLYTPDVLEDPFERKRIAAHIEAGEQARCLQDLPIIYVVLDDAKAVFTMYSTPGSYTTYLVTAPSLIHVFRLAFENLWNRAEPVQFAE